MKNLLTLLLCLTCSIIIWAQNAPQKSGVKFVDESITTILQQNTNPQKPIMVFVGTSDYCGSCKRIQSNVWDDLSVVAFFNRYFKNISIDVSDDQSIEKHQELLHELQPVIIPCFYFYSPKGEFLSTALGYKSPQEILQLAKSVLDSTK